MTKHFLSDPHLNHEGVLAMSKRPFASISDHDDHIIEQTNKQVAWNDELFILGDLSWGDPGNYLKRIKCRNLHLIVGNHDRATWGRYFKTVQDVHELKLRTPEGNSIKCFLSHYPHA